jgi:predicted glycosyltransferase
LGGSGQNGWGRTARVLLYSHDTYGLGHLRRTLALASFLRSRTPAVSQLLVTGSPLAHRFRLPADADYIKLPSVVKVAAERYESRDLSVSFRAVRGLRRDLLLAAARRFRPHVLVVDNVPTGLKGELVSALHHLRSTRCRLILGLRDVVDEPGWVRDAWARDGSYKLLDEVYDRILVYGDRQIYDLVSQYDFSPAAAAKTRFVGYLPRESGTRTPAEIRAELGVEAERLLLVMAGGGGDGYKLLRAVVEALGLARDKSQFQCLLVGGPLMPRDDRRRVVEIARTQPSVRYIDFVEDMASYVAAADAVVSMGGYNSVCELLSLGKRALIVPRVHPRKEQLIRAQALGARGFLRMIDPAELSPRLLFDEISQLLDDRTPVGASLPMDGLVGAAAEIGAQLAQPAVRHALLPNARLRWAS